MVRPFENQKDPEYGGTEEAEDWKKRQVERLEKQTQEQNPHEETPEATKRRQENRRRGATILGIVVQRTRRITDGIKEGIEEYRLSLSKSSAYPFPLRWVFGCG